MSGHSKWSTIKNKKGKTDAKRGKIFTKMSRSIIVAAREGGIDPEYNSTLKTAIEKAKAANMPNDNIERALKKAQGDAQSDQFEEILYEGYGPEGVAVIVSCLTDNRNRTAADVRHAFDKLGGNMGQSGSVQFIFDRFGVIQIMREGISEDQMMMDALESGALDMAAEEDRFMITTSVEDFGEVRDQLKYKGYSIDDSDLAYVPKNMVGIESEDHQKQMSKLLDLLEDNDDVQDVYSNWDQPSEGEE